MTLPEHRQETVRPVHAVLALALIALPSTVQARDSVVGFSCESAGKPVNWSFSVDLENGAVIADVPVNWASVTRTDVLFVHAVFANGRQYLTQQYTLDLPTGRLGACDYASADETPNPCETKLTCRPNNLTFSHAF